MSIVLAKLKINLIVFSITNILSAQCSNRHTALNQKMKMYIPLPHNLAFIIVPTLPSSSSQFLHLTCFCVHKRVTSSFKMYDLLIIPFPTL